MELLDTILVIIRDKLPLNYEADKVRGSIRIRQIRQSAVDAWSAIWLIGWFDLDGTHLMGVGRTDGPYRLDLADPSNTQEKIEAFIRDMLKVITNGYT